MSENNTSLVSMVDGVVKEVYTDVVHPVAEPVGDMLGFLPRTIKRLLIGWERWLINGEESLRLVSESIKDKMKYIPQDKIVEPEAYVAIPAIQNLCYCQDSADLRELYANLLAASMNADSKWDVHPAYIDIIRQLSPDEARIIQSLKSAKQEYYPLIDVKGTDLTTKDKNEGYQVLITNFTTVGFEVIEKKENICRYIDNLVRLNLVEIPPSLHLVKEEYYFSLKVHPVLSNMTAPFLDSFKISFTNKVFGLSNIGLSFKQICCNH